MSRTQIKAALTSAGRVFAAAALAAFLSSGESVSMLDLQDLRLLLDAGSAAVALTVVNALRRGETRFGLGAGEA
jgi:hypothetical protein